VLEKLREFKENEVVGVTGKPLARLDYSETASVLPRKRLKRAVMYVLP